MATLRSVLVLGPTGSVGKQVLKVLIRRKAEFTRIGAFSNSERPPSPAASKQLEELAAQGVEIVTGTFDDASAFKGFDVVLGLLGNHGIKYQPRIIDAAIAAGVVHYYPSEFGADLTVPGNWEMRYYRDKVLTREHLAKRGKDTPGFHYTLFINGRFSEWSILPHFGLFPSQHKAVIYGVPENTQSVLPLLAAAEYLVNTLLDPILPESPAERTYKFVENNYSYATIIQLLEQLQGVKYDVKYLPVAEALEKQKHAKEIGDVDLELQASHQLIQGTGRTVVPGPYDNARWPEVKLENLEEVLKRVLGNPEEWPLLNAER